MHIASVDYGLNCGLAIAKICVTETQILLEKYFLDTIYNNTSKVGMKIWEANCNSVVLEMCPSRASGEGLREFEDMQNQILRLEYTKGSSIYGKTQFVTIIPGRWKPFMRKQSVDLSSWHPKTKHEIDTMQMLWYAVRIENTKNLEIKYV